MKMRQNKIFYAVVKYLFKFLLKIYNRCSAHWLEKFNPDEKFIVACNHVSNLDPLVVGCFFPRRLKYFAKEELFHNKLFGACIRALGAVPVSRNDNASAAGALRGFMKLYQEGSDVLIFPEGGRSLDGKLQPLEGGVALIAARTQAPILPAFIKGSYEAMPTGSSIVKPKKITLTFGKPLRFSEEVYKSKEGRGIIMAELEKTMKELAALN
ncbi:MAG: 1-acyl-sn-glycerol-3-phosphate acyltransferase [Synergistaceae bacterium]|nr:1-acyl-sn-glycerol-3-phosphate acyltransferase [Synergistaceae bacterium]